MTIIELSFDEATEGMLLNHVRAVLDVLSTKNTNLREEKQALIETIATANVKSEAFEKKNGRKTSICSGGK